ncbi:hypothetical protein [Turneriella parva]|uniref:Uncharacterized protein n=1 Tax=Turneriella parva (strain ATCC BAA-1111 / DSM 21527 / NCTC 11395 / H) TaxID=869212 RepID=I4B8N0_TURPD|nr:hypothetical protein [Turneriella parva]AFM13637.1 hypothetical protein Turpa_2998 [Turneriella parva DSM 21527]
MKYKNFSEFKEAYKKRALSPEFRQAGLETMEKIHNEILDKPISEWLDIAADISPDRNGESEWRHALEAIVRDIRPKSQSIIVKNGRTGRDILEQATIDQWKDVVQRPIDFPPETVREIMSQKAVKELFLNVVHDSITGFTKSIKLPLVGDLNKVVDDKMIKGFLMPFMDSITKIATDFVNNKSNQPMMSEFAGKLLDIALDQKPTILDVLMDAEREEEIWQAIHTTASDKTFRKLAHEHTLDVIKAMKKDAGTKSLREWLKERNRAIPFSAPTDKELGHMQKVLAESEACAEFMFRELSFHS